MWGLINNWSDFKSNTLFSYNPSRFLKFGLLNFACASGNERAGEMAQLLRAFVVLPKDLGSIPNTHIVDHNVTQVLGSLTPFADLFRNQACIWHLDIQTKYLHT